MKGTDYIINPVVMGGLVKEAEHDMVKVHLHGRLGVLTVPRRLVSGTDSVVPGQQTEFYFSYIQVNETPYEYDCSSLDAMEFLPALVGGTITEVNDTAIQARIMNGLGTVAVPRRWVFTDLPLSEGQNIEFYLSPMRVVGMRDIPAECI